MTRWALAAVVGLLVLGGVSMLRAPQPQADLILSNGKVLTVDERFTIAQAVAVAGDRVVAVGSIQVGKLADLVVIDRDYLTVPADQIKDIKPVLTMVGGRIVYDAAIPTASR